MNSNNKEHTDGTATEAVSNKDWPGTFIKGSKQNLKKITKAKAWAQHAARVLTVLEQQWMQEEDWTYTNPARIKIAYGACLEVIELLVKIVDKQTGQFPGGLNKWCENQAAGKGFGLS
jgi:hypothetical protein